ncbi:uncharacterized protein KY384_005721 [Bacidia gigantensis]|uniref:uncharacterized protein n=1 Tax=Bacidia gigantensis TaxID=2732470 RepID=UPI001D052B6E|nr:uncharacterized protein KY384_005721 [Bacidia gigantensis]KAG8529086.1 hypothetical protein KY384_005721 [Bacidia gigantensis]
MMAFLNLPNEVLIQCIESAASTGDICAWTRVSRRLYHLANDILYDFNIKNDGGSALCWAAKHGHETTVRMMLDRKVNPNINLFREYDRFRSLSSMIGPTPLYEAASEGHVSVVRLLLAKGADPHIKTLTRDLLGYQYKPSSELTKPGRYIVSGSTPLHVVAANNHLEVAEALLQAGADPEAKTSMRENALFCALRLKHEKMAQLIASHSKNPNDVFRNPWDRETPLHLACSGKLWNTARFLISKGANVNAVDWAGLTPLHSALTPADPSRSNDWLNWNEWEEPTIAPDPLDVFKTVQLLLYHKAIPDLKTNRYRKACYLGVNHEYARVRTLFSAYAKDYAEQSVRPKKLRTQVGHKWHPNSNSPRSLRQHTEQPRRTRQKAKQSHENGGPAEITAEDLSNEPSKPARRDAVWSTKGTKQLIAGFKGDIVPVNPLSREIGIGSSDRLPQKLWSEVAEKDGSFLQKGEDQDHVESVQEEGTALGPRKGKGRKKWQPLVL